MSQYESKPIDLFSISEIWDYLRRRIEDVHDKQTIYRVAKSRLISDVPQRKVFVIESISWQPTLSGNVNILVQTANFSFWVNQQDDKVAY